MLLDFLPEFAKLGKVAGEPLWIPNHEIPGDTLENLEDQTSVLHSSDGLLPALGLAIVLQNEDALRFVGTIHLLSLRDHLLLKLDLLTLIHPRTGHLHLHLVDLRLRDFTANLTRFGTLELDQAVMAFAIGRCQDDAIRRSPEKRLLAMTYARDILDGTGRIEFLLLLCDGLQNGAPHQRIIQEVTIAGFLLGWRQLSHHDLLATIGGTIDHVSDLGCRDHRGSRIVPRIRSLLFISIILDHPTHVSIADPLAGFFGIPGLGKMFVGLAIGRARTTSEKCVFLHLFANVSAHPLVGV